MECQVSDSEIVAFLAKLINGEISLQEAESFFDDCMNAFSDDALEAVLHYIDDAAIREKDLRNGDSRYEIWTRLDILDAYCSYVLGERFSVKQFAYCLACRLGCGYGESTTKRSCSFCLKRNAGVASWELEIEFFVGRVRVVVREREEDRHSKCMHPAIGGRQLYDGPWLGLDFQSLRRVVLSGDADQMRQFAESCGKGKTVQTSSGACLTDSCGANPIADAHVVHEGDDGIVSLLAKTTNGELPLRDAAVRFEQFRDALSDSVRAVISKCIDNADNRKTDLSQELWTRLSLLCEYVTYMSGEKFSLKQFLQCLACRLGCRWGHDTAGDSIAFCLKRRSVFSSWKLTMKLLRQRICVDLSEDSWLFRSRRRQSRLYDGPWTELDFHELRRRVMSGEVDRTMDPMKYRRPYEGGW